MHNNEVEFLGYYGSDEVHACSAWTSTNRDITPKKKQKIPALLKMLAENGHHTPFEKSSLHFLVTSDIATHIHLLKHRIGVSINGESARYKELKEDKYYLPNDWAHPIPVKRSDHIKFGDPQASLSETGLSWIETLAQYTELGNKLYHAAIQDLEPVIGRKRAKESARFFKTYNSQIQADIIFNWRSFYHFLSLRNKPDAQKEIREIAESMLSLVKSIEGNPFEHTIAAFNL